MLHHPSNDLLLEHNLRSTLVAFCDVSKTMGAFEHHPTSSTRRADLFVGIMGHLGYEAVSTIPFVNKGPGAYNPVSAVNVLVGPWKEPGKLWFSAHHDYCGGTGAADNGTALAVLTEVAKRLPKQLRNEVVFSSFGFEEQSAKGSKSFIKQYPAVADNIAAFVNLECLGISGWTTVIVDSRYEGKLKSDKLLVQILKQANPSYPLFDCPTGFISDGYSFQRRNSEAPVVEVMGIPKDGCLNPVHSRNDVIENIDFGELTSVVHTLIEFTKLWYQQQQQQT
jgi:hypothetical protein